MNVEESLFRAGRAESPRSASRDRVIAAAVVAVEVSRGGAGLVARLRYVLLAAVGAGAVALGASRAPSLGSALEPTSFDAVPRAEVEVARRALPSVGAPEERAPRGVTTAPTPPKPSEAVRDEDDLVHLLEAKRRLASGDSASALEALGRVRGSALRDEADALRIDALVATGDVSGARAVFRRFEAAHPASPYTQRLRALVREEPGQ